MKYTTTGRIVRVWPIRNTPRGNYSSCLFSVIENKTTLFLKLEQFKNGGNIHYLNKSQPGDLVEVTFKIRCKNLPNGYPLTDLIVTDFKTLDAAGQELKQRALKAISKLKDKPNIHRVNIK